MSTNRNCLFVQMEPGRWYYILEHEDAPRDAASWLDYATAYGHFADAHQTEYHLRENHPAQAATNIIPGDRLPSVTKLIAECDTRRMTPRVNGHHAMRPSGKPRLMPQTRRAKSMTNTTRRYTVMLIETITREAVIEVDVLPNQDNLDAEQVALHRLATGYDIPWREPKKTVRAMGAIK